MVHEEETFGLQSGAGVVGDIRGPVGLAGEIGRRSVVVVVLEDIGEFVHEVRCVGVGVQVGDERHQAGVVGDEVLEGWP